MIARFAVSERATRNIVEGPLYEDLRRKRPEVISKEFAQTGSYEPKWASRTNKGLIPSLIAHKASILESIYGFETKEVCGSQEFPVAIEKRARISLLPT